MNVRYALFFPLINHDNRRNTSDENRCVDVVVIRKAAPPPSTLVCFRRCPVDTLNPNNSLRGHRHANKKQTKNKSGNDTCPWLACVSRLRHTRMNSCHGSRIESKVQYKEKPRKSCTEAPISAECAELIEECG